MVLTRVHHVGIIAADLTKAWSVFCDGFGLAVDEHRTPWPQGRPGDYDDVTTIEIPLGEMYLEISKPNTTTSDAARFLADRNDIGGIYYVALASDDIATDVRRLTAKGVKLQKEGDQGAAVFLDRSACLGLNLQITPEDHYYVHPYYRGDGTYTGLGHVGVASRDTADTRHFWGDVVGLLEDRSTEREQGSDESQRQAGQIDDPVETLVFPLGGTVIEVVHPLRDTSGTGRFVSQRAPLGSAYHHFCLFAPDVRGAVAKGVAAGLQQIGTLPTDREAPGVGWFHPRSCLGTLVEMWGSPPSKGHMSQPSRM